MVQNQISSIIKDIRDIVRKYRAEAAIKLNETIIHERWEIGRRIVEEDQKGQERAEYGTKLIPGLSKQLTLELGRGFSERSWHIIVNYILTIPIGKFCRHVCKICHGLIFRQLLVKKMKKPETGISQNVPTKCGQLKRSKEISVRNIITGCLLLQIKRLLKMK